MNDPAPLFPRTVFARLRLAAESIFFVTVGVYSVFNWPPVGAVIQGIWSKLFLLIIFELLLTAIPFGILGLWWALFMPDWIQTTYQKVERHLFIVVAAMLFLSGCGMLAGFLGWW